MSKIWVDVSHILGWKGVLSGIERVEYHLVCHYFENSEAGYITWDKGNNSFVEVTRTDIRKQIVERTSEQEMQVDSVSSSQGLIHRLTKKLRTRPAQHVHAWKSEGTVILLAGLWDDRGYIAAVMKVADSNPIVHVVYDMIPLVQPGFVVDYLPSVFSEYMLNILPKCKKIMAISEATKKDIIRVLEIRKLKVPEIIAFRLGDDLTRSEKSTKPQGVPQGDFILAISTVEARKNHQLLYYTAKLAYQKGLQLPPFVIAGRRGWLTDNFQYTVEHDPEVESNIILIDRVSDSDISWLYENCLFTVFPSFCEGWGLPVAEALGYGKVTLASDMSSIPEVGGDNADYFSPFSPDDLLELIIRYTDKAKRKTKENYIKENYKRHEWEAAAAEFSDRAIV